jgi:serine/threonine-protein kinase
LSLTIGTQLGSHEITALLGKGGMGEVYRARDLKLKREVAIKILPEEFARDADRVSRFQREAELLASLNHPNIAGIHELADANGSRYLVLELVEGETLAGRIARGPIPVAEALEIGRHICEALEAAHEKGIVHRDLKPANVKIAPEGKVKVLDFGLAKMNELGHGPANLSQSPTMMTAASSPGLILGTAAYMSPEQAKGKLIDRRADIWAFGVVMVEMLTGTSLYTGETVSEVLASVIMKEPDLASLPASLPGSVVYLIRRCLEKDPKRRLRDIGEARILLSDPTSITAVDAPPAEARRDATGNRWWIAALVGAVVVAAALAAILWLKATGSAVPVVRYDVTPPGKAALELASRPAVALSPDGSRLVFVATEDGIDRLYMRKRDEVEVKVIAGSEGASDPEFSPDGRSVAFFASGALKKMSLDGAMTTLATGAETRGLSWIDSSTIVYTPDTETGLFEVSLNGGEPRGISMLDAAKKERSHRWPHGLPGGKAVLFTVGSQATPDDYDSSNVEALVLATGERHIILQGASMARYSAAGYLIFARGGSLHAVAFDPNRLQTSGPPMTIVQGVAGDRTTGAVHFSIANDGTLAYTPGSAGGVYELVWVDRTGKVEPIGTPRGFYMDPNISRDGTKAAVTMMASGDGSNYDIWIYDFVRKTFTRLTFAGFNETPIWSWDGKYIFYSSITLGSGKSTIFRKPADGSRDAEELISLDVRAYLRDVRPDGKAILDVVTGKSEDVVQVELKAGSKPVPLVATSFNEIAASISPDGRFLAYAANDSGRNEVYVRDLSGLGGRWQISTSGGEEPNWSPDGHELFYRNNDLLMVAAVDTRSVFQASSPKLLVQSIPNLRLASQVTYALDPKGGRFLMIRPVGGDVSAQPVRIVQNWFSELRSTFQSK